MDDEDGSPAWLVPRGSWGAEQSRHLSHLHTTPGSVFVTYSGKNPCTNREWCVFAIRKLQQAHIYSRNCPDIRYNFCIGGDGKVYEGRGWEVRPTLPRKYSDFTCTSLYIAYMGNFLHKQPGDIMHRALETLLVYGVQNKFIRPKFLQFRI